VVRRLPAFNDGPFKDQAPGPGLTITLRVGYTRGSEQAKDCIVVHVCICVEIGFEIYKRKDCRLNIKQKRLRRERGEVGIGGKEWGESGKDEPDGDVCRWPRCVEFVYWKQSTHEIDTGRGHMKCVCS